MCLNVQRVNAEDICWQRKTWLYSHSHSHPSKKHWHSFGMHFERKGSSEWRLPRGRPGKCPSVSQIKALEMEVETVYWVYKETVVYFAVKLSFYWSSTHWLSGQTRIMLCVSLLLVFGDEVVAGQWSAFPGDSIIKSAPCLCQPTQSMLFHELLQREFGPGVIFGNLQPTARMFEEHNHVTMVACSWLWRRRAWRASKQSANATIWLTVRLLMLTTVDAFQDVWCGYVHNQPMQPFSNGRILARKIVRICRGQWEEDDRNLLATNRSWQARMYSRDPHLT